MPKRSWYDSETALIPGAWTHKFSNANGIRFHSVFNQSFQNNPTDTALVLVHGFGEFWWSWQKILTILEENNIPAVAIDLRGYGASDKPPRGYDAWTLSADVKALLSLYNLKKVKLVTHGTSTIIGWTVTNLYPELVELNVTISGAHPVELHNNFFHNLKQAKSLAKFIFPGQIPWIFERKMTKNNAEFIRNYFVTYSGSGWQNMPNFSTTLEVFRKAQQIPQVPYSELEFNRWLFRSRFRSDGKKFLQQFHKNKIITPTLALTGEKETLFLPETIENGKYWCTNFLYKTLPKVGHFPHLEAPLQLGDILIKYNNHH